MKNKLFPDEHIVECLAHGYGFDVAALTFLPIGADPNASVYKAVMRDQTTYFVKLKRGHEHDNGVAIATFLFDSGIEEIIPTVKTRAGSPIERVGAFSLIVYPFIEGENGFTRNLADDQWVTFGQAMRRVHDIQVPPPLESQIRREAYSAQWRDAVRALYTNIEAHRGGDEAAVELAAFMKMQAATIHRLVDRSEQLAHEMAGRPAKFVLCHSDLHGGNVLVDSNGKLYIMDWDEPIMAPKERDLMYIGGGVGKVWNKSREEQLFYEGYGETHVDAAILAYYRHERIVEDMALFGRSLLLTAEGGKDRRNSLELFEGMFEPQSVVDMALKADRDDAAS